MEKTNLTNRDGDIIEAYWQHFILNDKQQFVVVGADIALEDIKLESLPGVEIEYMGLLEEQNFIFCSRAKNSLHEQGWDFDHFENPPLFLLTDKR